MQTTLQTLTAHIAEAVRRNLPPISREVLPRGFGQASDLAAQHPAFAPASEGTHGSAWRPTTPVVRRRDQALSGAWSST